MITLLASLLLFACATAPGPVGDNTLLAFLDRPPITRDEVYRRLGPPHEVFEKERIASFRLGEIPAGYYVVPDPRGWQGVRYDLLVEFDADDRAQAYRLVTVR